MALKEKVVLRGCKMNTTVDIWLTVLDNLRS